MSYAGRTAVISGGASGIGESVCRMLAERQANVAILDVNEDRGERLAGELGPAAAFHRIDVTSESQVVQALDSVMEQFGAIDFNGNFAGITHVARTLGRNGPFDFDAYKHVIDVNLSGVFNMSRLCAERMARNALNDHAGSRGAIVNTASAAAFDGQVGQAAYAGSKGGVVAMTLPLARDLSRIAVRVNAIAPGLISTPLVRGGQDALTPEVEAYWKPMMEHIPHPRRFGDPDEVAALVLHLFENEYINGECIRIDAGLRMPFM